MSIHLFITGLFKCIFTTQRYARAVYAVIMSVCVCVCHMLVLYQNGLT